jgi:hypothetical protein
METLFKYYPISDVEVGAIMGDSELVAEFEVIYNSVMAGPDHVTLVRPGESLGTVRKLKNRWAKNAIRWEAVDDPKHWAHSTRKEAAHRLLLMRLFPKDQLS